MVGLIGFSRFTGCFRLPCSSFFLLSFGYYVRYVWSKRLINSCKKEHRINIMISIYFGLSIFRLAFSLFAWCTEIGFLDRTLKSNGADWIHMLIPPHTHTHIHFDNSFIVPFGWLSVLSRIQTVWLCSPAFQSNSTNATDFPMLRNQ